MDQIVENIIKGDQNLAKKSLRDFVNDTTETFSFPDLNHNNKRKELWNAIYNLTKSTNDPELLINCFMSIRILSREKTNLNELITEEWIDLIKQHSGLTNNEIFNIDKKLIAIEALKCLCNVIFNSNVAAVMCCKMGILNKIMERMKSYKSDFPDDIKFFDMKIVFLLTALCPEIRNIAKTYNYDVNLIDLLETVLNEANENAEKAMLTDKQTDLICEILKGLFNLTMNIDGNDEDELIKYDRLVTVLRILLLTPTNSQEKTCLLQNNIINLLINMPAKSFKHLITEINNDENISNHSKYESNNMTVFHEILQFLTNRFVEDPTVSKQHEILSPVISILVKGANNDRRIRKYLRTQILPPLKDVHSRPEQGTTLRNHLCRLLTSPITQIRDLVAELLFVLCKKNVNRMIKYTGYGNAAGLFAQRGLLGGRSDEGEADYSSDSQESETEEYAEYKHGINPVIGCYEAPHPNAMENMTEEQKEFEAMKLVELMDNLTKCGAIKPCRVGADGKPHPIGHVLELQKDIKNQTCDSDDSE